MMPAMNRHLFLLSLCQGLFLTNNVVFIAINGLVGLELAPVGWMATLPVTGYVVGASISAPLVARVLAPEQEANPQPKRPKRNADPHEPAPSPRVV